MTNFQISTLEGRVFKLQNNIDGLLYKLNNACDIVRNIQEEVNILYPKSCTLFFSLIHEDNFCVVEGQRQATQTTHARETENNTEMQC